MKGGFRIRWPDLSNSVPVSRFRRQPHVFGTPRQSGHGPSVRSAEDLRHAFRSSTRSQTLFVLLRASGTAAVFTWFRVACQSEPRCGKYGFSVKLFIFEFHAENGAISEFAMGCGGQENPWDRVNVRTSLIAHSQVDRNSSSYFFRNSKMNRP